MKFVDTAVVQHLGACAYTTVRLHQGKLLFWQAHQQRLHATCRFLGFAVPSLNTQDIEHAAPGQGLCRITVTASEVYVSFREFKPIPQAIHLTISNMNIHPMLGLHKTGNMLPYTLAAHPEYFESLLWDASGRYLVDGTRSGFMLHNSEKIIVPKGGLPSVTRAELLGRWNVAHEERDVTLSDLHRAKHVWLCGSGMGVLAVHTLSHQNTVQNYDVRPIPIIHPAFTAPES